MTLNWRQALTSALVGFAAGAVVSWVIHGALGRDELAFAAAIGLAIGASRLIEIAKR